MSKVTDKIATFLFKKNVSKCYLSITLTCTLCMISVVPALSIPLASTAEASSVPRNWATQMHDTNYLHKKEGIPGAQESKIVFDCGEVIGKVFNDVNRNGYQDIGEPGLPGVNVITVNGVRITTDIHGQFNVSCAEVPEMNASSNFVMKLDTRTLPSGYYLIDENPRNARVSQGKVTKMNFGAVLGPVVRLDLNDGAFEIDGSALKAKWLTSINKLITVLIVEPSTLRMTYYVGGQKRELARERVATLQRIIEERWVKYEQHYTLPIEVRIVYKNE